MDIQSILGWAIVPLTVLTVFSFWDYSRRAGQKKAAAIEVADMRGFKPGKSLLKTAIKTKECQGLAIDPDSRQLCLINGSARRLISFDKLVSAEVVVDGATVTTTSRLNQLGGAAVGALVAGGVGAVIGGLSGATTSKQNVNEVTLKLLLDDLQAPTHKVQFIEMNMTGKTAAEAALNEAQEWADTLKIVVFQSRSNTASA